MPIRAHSLLLPALLLVPLFSSPWGGWATITVDDMPDAGVAGKPLVLSFVVRQHGVTPLKGLHPTIEARAGASTARADAEPGKEDGRYSAELVLREPGDWTITINSGFGKSKLTLLPFRVAPAVGSVSHDLADYERGRRLFVSKGCVGCHTRAEADVEAGEMIGPVLTGKRWEPAFLRRFLADPAANATHTGTFRMPNLGLKQAEIGYLAIFLNAERKGTSQD